MKVPEEVLIVRTVNHFLEAGPSRKQHWSILRFYWENTKIQRTTSKHFALYTLVLVACVTTTEKIYLVLYTKDVRTYV